MRFYLENWEKELCIRYKGAPVKGPQVDECTKVRIHARGLFPDNLFQQRFPTEPPETFEYRKATYKPITQSAYLKIFNTVIKIAYDSGFSIAWPSESKAIMDYCTNDYPEYDSLLHWLFDIGLHAQLIEPNGVVAIVPLTWEWADGELPKPYAKIYKPESVVYHKEGEKTILKESDGVFTIIDATKIGRVEVLPGDKFATQVLFVHNFGSAPTFMIGGDATDYQSGYYQSFISGCVPHWDCAVLDNSVLRAAIHGHVYPEYQVIEVSDCTVCAGRGRYHVTAPDGASHSVDCHACGGTGKAHSPGFGNIAVRLDEITNDTGNPMAGPVKQYINKDFSSIPILEASIAKSLQYAYSAVNMDFLAEVPAAQSGIAKAYDRAYLNSFLAKVANQLLGKMLKWIIYYIIMYREFWAYKLTKFPIELMPIINIPDNFDVLPQDTIMNELQTAKVSGAPNIVLDFINDALIASTLGNKSDDIKEFEIIKSLDPLYGYTISDKLAIKAAGGVSQKDFVLTMHINQWVKYAAKHISKDGKPFLEWDEVLQKEYLDSKANDYIRQSVQDSLPGQDVFGGERNVDSL